MFWEMNVMIKEEKTRWRKEYVKGAVCYHATEDGGRNENKEESTEYKYNINPKWIKWYSRVRY